MATSTHRVAVDDTKYVNVSNGNLNLTIFAGYRQHLRIVVGGTEPPVDHPDFVPLQQNPNQSARIVLFSDLPAEDDVWVRTELGADELACVRGETQIAVYGGGY